MAEARWRRGSLAVAITVIGLLAVTVVTLLTAAAPAPDRVQELSERLRCPVCKSVSIAESPSETAAAMRQAVTEQVAAGRTDEEIVDYFRARYGDWALLDPPRRGTTLLVWLVPLGAAAVGALLVMTRVRRRPEMPDEELPAATRERLDAAVDRVRADLRSGEDEP
ncbi:cytochrome c-type biogenesis protein [Pseudonocardia nigra]|uniref:cytochrome c-type biogenesis protein n=1 Tax=Pseudonocardia nigra TaxID=1921578 RepID=UPI001C5F1ED4|nr:cytochrome c-type biogenesis protein [Pseudonocardia nigra]